MANVAQLAEHLVVVQDVAGSSPVVRPYFFSPLSLSPSLPTTSPRPHIVTAAFAAVFRRPHQHSKG